MLLFHYVIVGKDIFKVDNISAGYFQEKIASGLNWFALFNALSLFLYKLV